MRNSMILIAVAAAAGLMTMAAPVRAQTVDWRVAPADKAGDVQFTLSRRSGNSHWINSNTTPLAELQGLSAAQLSKGGSTPVRFSVTRGAGLLDCSGNAGSGRGSGSCGFRADPAFVAALQRRGIGGASEAQMFSLTMAGIGREYLDELDRQRYAKPTVGDLIRAGEHGARLDYLRAVGAAGYRPGTVSALVRMRNHGVSANFVREVAAAGMTGLGAEDLVTMRSHGVSPRFVAEMRSQGYRSMKVTAA
jgi:hypothetical protein